MLKPKVSIGDVGIYVDVCQSQSNSRNILEITGLIELRFEMQQWQ